MEELGFTNLLWVVGAAFVAPLALGLVPRLRLPAVVLEIVLGIVLGPHVLGVVEIDAPVEVVALLGLAFLLFLAGLELDPDGLRGPVLRTAGMTFGVTLVVALACGLVLDVAGLAGPPLFVAVALSATSLGVVLAVLKDAGRIATPFGQTVIAAASVADFGAIVLLTLLFGGEAGGTGAKLVLLAFFCVLVAAAGLIALGASHSMRISDALVRLQDTTAQIRVRAALLLLVALAALAGELGLEVILGAFAAGALIAAVDRDREMTHPQFRLKLEAIGFGVFIPVFFVASGVRFDLAALAEDAAALASIPAFLAALLLVRGAPMLLARRALPDGRERRAAALLTATSLPFIVTATQIGLAMDLIDPAPAAGMVAAGLVSVLVFPLAATTLLSAGAARGRPAAGAPGPPGPPAPAAAPR
jgi:Kef-type K+ transport system membrane component KefB